MMVRASERIVTSRLLLRRPGPRDAAAILSRYAGDADVTRYVGWSRHHTVGDTEVFLSYADHEWRRWPAGPYLIESRETGALLGSTGLGFETSYRAATGYVLAVDAWGHGFATEALRAMINVARQLQVQRLYALCHVEHGASAHVLEKCGFSFEGVLRRYAEFPNLTPVQVCDVRCYALTDLTSADRRK